MPSATNGEDRNQKREELKANWKTPAVAQFVSLFRVAFKLPEIEIEDLEEGLINEESVERKILVELLVAILHGINIRINSQNWSQYLEKLVQKSFAKGSFDYDPYSIKSSDAVKVEANLEEDVFDINYLLKAKEIPSEKAFWSFDTWIQIDIIHFVCLMRLDRGDVVEAMKNMDSDALRAQPLGCDDMGNEYWYFYGTRLYKQAPAPKKNEKKWEDEWNQQKQEVFKKRGPGRPPKKIRSKPRKSDGESEEFEDVDNQSNRKFMNIDERSRWSVVCNTIEDWIEFAEKFKNSKSRCEKALFEIVQENFLPALNDIYLEKERRLQKKLKELMALRSPAISRMETRRHTTIVHDELNDSSESYEEESSKNREHRLVERSRQVSVELRPRRKTRKSVRYYDEEDNDGEMSEEISDETYEEPIETADDKYVRDYYPLFSEDGIDVKKEVIKLIGEVKLHKDAWPFINPVKKEEAPGYYEIISQPIDLTIITQKLVDGSYRTLSQLDADFRKLVSNCRLYNGEHAGPTKMVNSIYKTFQQGVSKILDIHRGCDERTSRNVESNHTSNGSKNTRSEVFVKRNNNNSYERKRKKRKMPNNIEALETLSRESELAVEKSNSSDYLESLQAKKKSTEHTSFSSFRIIPIHSNPSEVVEKLMSQSSNQDAEDIEECDDTMTAMAEEAENSEIFDQNNSSLSHDSNVCGLFDSPDSEGNSVFMDHSDPESASSPQEAEENADIDNSNLHSTNTSSRSLRKSSSGSADGVMHSVANIIEDCRTQSVSNLMSGFNREPIYSASDRNQSPNSRSAISPHSRKSDTSTSEHTRESPQNSISNFTQSSIVEKHVPLLQDSLSIQSDFGNFTSSHETSTVDASVLGFSSFPPVTSRVSPLSMTVPNNKQLSPPPVSVPNTIASFLPLTNKQLSPPPVSIPNTVASFMPLTSKQLSPPPVSVPNTVTSFLPLTSTARFAGSPQGNSYEKMFTSQNPIQLVKSDPNKFPTVHLNLPPSNGEILIVPDKNDSSKTVFHLFAQPHGNQSQPIQSSIELRANISPTGFANQSNEIVEVRSSKSESTTMTTSRRKSPSMDAPQFPIISNGPQVPFEKSMTGAGFPNLLKPVTTYPSFSMNSNSASVSSAFGNTFMPLNATSIHPPSTTSDLPIIRSSNYNPLDINSNKAFGSSNGLNFDSEIASTTMQSNNSTRTVNSGLGTTVLSSPRQPKSSKKIRHRVDVSVHKEATSSVQKVFAPSGTYLFNSNGLMPNGNGQFEILTLSKTDDVQQVSKMQNHDRSNQNGFKSFSESMPTAFYSPTYTNSLQNFTFPTSSLNPPLVYQVNPNQPSQFVNLPNYMFSGQNMFQHPLSNPIVNMQPFQVPNRPVISMDLGNR